MNTEILGMTITEIVGYAASATVLFSFLNKNVKRLRIFNFIGCALFVIYGLALETSWPIVITNAAIMLIHTYYLFLVKMPATDN